MGPSPTFDASDEQGIAEGTSHQQIWWYVKCFVGIRKTFQLALSCRNGEIEQIYKMNDY